MIYRDEIDLKALREARGSKLEVVLVDHHSLSDEDIYLVDLVVKIIDHRPRDERWAWPGREISLESVGSCATLVARDFLKKHPEVIDSQISSLLQGKQTHIYSNESCLSRCILYIGITALFNRNDCGNLNRPDLDRYWEFFQTR